MKKYGAFEIRNSVYELHEEELSPTELEGAQVEPATGRVLKNGKAIGVQVDAKPRRGFNTPSKKLEIYSETMKEWGWPEYVLPGYIRSQVHREVIHRDQGEFVLVPTFRLPTLIHTRSANAKWLNEISHRNPIWMNPRDADRTGVRSGDLLRVSTSIGYLVNRVWVTDAIAPGVIACSHHLGRWRLRENEGSRWGATRVELTQTEKGILMRHAEPQAPFKSTDRDTSRIWWSDSGVHQNLAFPVQPDPVSGNNCWHQKVKVEKAWNIDHYGDVFVSPTRAREVVREWLAKTRPSTGNLRRPQWLDRPFRPAPEAFFRVDV